jgi:drug/metabolite transporter (DMT)-like permease
VLESGAALGFCAALTWGMVDVTVAVLARRASPLAVTIAVQATGVVMLVGLALALGEGVEVTGAQWALVVALSPVSGLAYLTFYKALGLGPVAIVSPIASANGVLVVGLAVLILGDSLSGVQALGAAVVLACAVLAGTEGSERGRGATGPGGPRLAAIASIAFGGYLFGLVVLVEDLGWLLPILLTRSGGLVVLATLAARRGGSLRLDGRALAFASAAGVLEVAGYLMFNRGADVGEAATTAAAAAAYPVVPALYGVLALRERLAPHQVAGVVGVLAGKVLLSLG